MRTRLIIAVIFGILFALFMIFYGGYYLINPDQRGEDILAEFGIPHPAVIAHRGSSIEAPESTRAAYVMARDTGADYLEADVQRTSDGELVIFHDANLRRTTNIEEVFPDRAHLEIGNFTYEELQELDAGSWFNEVSRYASPEYEGEKIITLQELIEIAKGGNHTPGLILESKHPEKYRGIEEDIVEVLQEENWLDNDEIDDFPEPAEGEQEFARTIFFSFSPQSLRNFRELAPEVPRLLLITDTMIGRRNWSSWLEMAEEEELAQGLGPKGFMSWPWHVAAAHERGMFVFPYTINELWQIKVLARFHASGYITDRPDVVLSFLDRLPELPDFPDLAEETGE